VDRTLEFHQIVASRRSGQPPPPPTARPPIRRTEFAAAASSIGADIASTASKLGKLTQLAQSRSLFEDPTAEINELMDIIKNEITQLNGKLAGLQGALTSTKAATGSGGKQRITHSSSVVDVVKTKLMDLTREFQEVLHTRSHNMELINNRRNQFSAAGGTGGAPGGAGGVEGGGAGGAGGSVHGDSASDTSFGGGGCRSRFAPPTPIFELCAPPTAGSSASGGGSAVGATAALHKKTDNFAGDDGLCGCSAAWASPAAKPAGMVNGEGGAVVIDMSEVGGQQQQQMLSMNSAYLDQRAHAVDSVHATIAELGGIFQQLTAMVAEQGSRLQRVDENLDDSVSNVTEGHAQLLRYWSNLRSSRGLMMRVFAILLFFIVVWGTLFA